MKKFKHTNVRFEVFTAVKNQVEALLTCDTM